MKNKIERIRESKRLYKKSVKGKLAEKRYRQTKKRKQVLAKYNKSDKGKIVIRAKAIRHYEKKIFKSINKLLSFKDYISIMSLYENKCFNCGKKNNKHSERAILEIEHYYPASKGYNLFYNGFNACVLCHRCNTLKRDKMPEIFYDESKLNKFKWLRARWLK